MSCVCLCNRRSEFFGFRGGVCSVIGHMVWACLWYVSIMLMTHLAALSMCVGVMAFEVVRYCMKLDAFSSVVWVLAFPNW